MSKTRPPSDRQQPPPEELRVFREAMRDVKPLAQAPLPSGLEAPAPRPRRLRRPLETRIADLPLVPVEDAGLADAPQVPVVGPGDELVFRRGGVRDQTMRRLRRGQLAVDDAIDLHGLGQAHARDLLVEFIERSRARGCRCVRVVHGKGHRSGTRGPILKSAVNLWLRRHADVMAFVSARAIDGGTGAVYVLLRAA